MGHPLMNDYDFSGCATKYNIKCSDGRTIMKDAFKHCDGKVVPLVWNHRHDTPNAIIGKALLVHNDDGVYTYGKFNDTETGATCRELLKHGDIESLSIYANRLKESMKHVIHGEIREVSLVLAGANIEALIDNVIVHGEVEDEAAWIYMGEGLELHHADEGKQEGAKEMPGTENKDMTVQDVIDSMNEDQQTVLNAMVAKAYEDGMAAAEENDDEEDGGDVEMKHNVFDMDEQQGGFLSHADEEAIMALAKTPNVGTFKTAMQMYVKENAHLAHGINGIEELFPEYELTNPGAPELLTDDQSWVQRVISKAHKSPISRIRTRQADARNLTPAALGYKKGEEKKFMGNLKLINRTTDPQTIYVKDKLERDDIVDITDFDVAAYQDKVMTMMLHEKLATAMMMGDGLEDGTDDKIDETKIRPIYGDDPLYTIYADVDIEAARTEIQGTNTSANFGENYIYAEAIIAAALHAREQYKGSGSLDFYCTPHLLNVMLLARDLNGRRIYDSKADLAKALNVSEIFTVEQMEGKTREDKQGKTHKLLGLFVNFANYHLGATKGGQVTSFEDFDIDFNQYKYLKETRCSGANTRVLSAIALEEPVA